MVRLSASFFLLSLVATSFSIPVKRDIGQVKHDIDDITKGTLGLQKATDDFANPGGTGPQAIAIDTAGRVVAHAFQTGTKNLVANGAFSETDAKSVLTAANNFVGPLLNTLDQLVKKKPAFAKIGVTGDLYRDLKSFGGDVKAYGTALYTDTPDDLKPNVKKVTDNVNKAFVDAVAAFAS